MNTSELYNMPLAELYKLRRESYNELNAIKEKDFAYNDQHREVTTNAAYLQKVIQDRESN